MSNGGFEYGAVLTSTEVDGCSPNADWYRWIKARKAPPCPFHHPDDDVLLRSWAEDLDQLDELGATSVAITIEWASLEPDQGRHDNAAIELRLAILQLAKERGFEVWGCLIDGTLPGWFAQNEGGFVDDNARGLIWPRHIDWVGETFGELVDGWIPQREPLHWALRRNLVASAPPGLRDGKKAAAAARAGMLADYEAWRLLQGTAPVATYQTARLIHHESGGVAKMSAETAAPKARGVERMLWHPWVGALTEGKLEVGDLPVRQHDGLRGAFDKIIVELRPPVLIDGNGRWFPYPADQTPGPSGWVGWQEAFIEALHRVNEELSDYPIIAAGNLADIVDDGANRADHQQQMMASVLEMAGSGDTGVQGWWQSSPIDGYHYKHGFNIQPGLITRQRETTGAAEKFRLAARSV